MGLEREFECASFRATVHRCPLHWVPVEKVCLLSTLMNHFLRFGVVLLAGWAALATAQTLPPVFVLNSQDHR